MDVALLCLGGGLFGRRPAGLAVLCSAFQVLHTAVQTKPCCGFLVERPSFPGLRHNTHSALCHWTGYSLYYMLSILYFSFILSRASVTRQSLLQRYTVDYIVLYCLWLCSKHKSTKQLPCWQKYSSFTFTFTFMAFGRRFYPKRLQRVHLLKERQQYIAVVYKDKNRAGFKHSQ